MTRHQFKTGLAFPADLLTTGDTRKIQAILERADLVAYHGMHGPGSFPWPKHRLFLGQIARRKPSVTHYHTNPEGWDRSIPNASGMASVSIWYHAEHAPAEWRRLPHCIDTGAVHPPADRPVYDGRRKLRVAWTPSTTLDKAGSMSNKGHAKTVSVLRSLRDIVEPVTASHIPQEQALKLRGSCHVGLDELVSGSIHQTTIENMALGLVPVFRATGLQVTRVIGAGLTLPGCNAVNGHGDLAGILRWLAEEPERVAELQAEARRQSERWDGRHIAPLYAAFYDDALAAARR